MMRAFAFAAALPYLVQSFSLYATLDCDDTLYTCGAGGASILKLSVWKAMPIRLMPTCTVEYGDGIVEEFSLRSVDSLPTKIVSSVEHRYSVGGTFLVRTCCGADCIEAELKAGIESTWAWYMSTDQGSVRILGSSGPALTTGVNLPVPLMEPGSSLRASATALHVPAGQFANFALPCDSNVTAWLVDTPVRVTSSSMSCESGVCQVSVTAWIDPSRGGQRSLPLCVHAAALPTSTQAVLPLLQNEADFYSRSSSRCVLLDVEAFSALSSAHEAVGEMTTQCASGIQPQAVTECFTGAAGCVGQPLPEPDQLHRPQFTAHGAVSSASNKPMLLGGTQEGSLGALIARAPLPASAAEAGEWSIATNVSIVGYATSVRTVALFLTKKLPGPALWPEDEITRVDASGVLQASSAHVDEPHTVAALLTREAGSPNFRASLVACDSASTTWESCKTLLSTSFAYIKLPCLHMQGGDTCKLQLTSVRTGAGSSKLSLLADGSLILNGTANIMSSSVSTTSRAGISAEVAGCIPGSNECSATNESGGLAVHVPSVAAGEVSPALSTFLWADNIPVGSALVADVARFVYHLRTACGSLTTSSTATQDAIAWLTASQGAEIHITPCTAGILSALCGYIARSSAAVTEQSSVGLWVVGTFHVAPLSDRPPKESRSVDALRLSFSQGSWVTSTPASIQDVHLSALPLPLITIRSVYDLSLAVPVPAWVTTGPWVHKLVMQIADGCGTISLAWTWSASFTPSPVLIARWRDLGYANAGVWPVRVNSSEGSGNPQLTMQSLLGVASVEMLTGQADLNASLVTFCTGTAQGCDGVLPGSSSTLSCPASLTCVRTARVSIGGQATVLVFVRDARGNVVDPQAVAALAGSVAVTLTNVTAYGSLQTVSVSPVTMRTLTGAVPALAFDVTLSASAAQLSITLGGHPLPLSPLWLVALPGQPSAPQSAFTISSCIGYGTVRSGRSGMAVVILRDKDGMAIVEPQTLRALISSSRLRVDLTPPAACSSKVYGGSITLSTAAEGALLVRFTALCAGVYGLRITVDGQALPTTYETSTCPMTSAMGPCPGLSAASPLCVLPGTPVPSLSELQMLNGVTPGVQAVLTAGATPVPVARIRLMDAFGQTVPLSSLPTSPWPIAAPGEDVILSVQTSWAANVTVRDTMDGSGWAVISASSTRAGQWPVVATLLASGLATTVVQSLGAGSIQVTVAPAALEVPRSLVSGTVTGVGQGEIFSVEVMARDVFGNKRSCTVYPEVVQAAILDLDGLPTNNATAVIQCVASTGVQSVSVDTANLTVGSTIRVLLCSAAGVPLNTCPPVIDTKVGPSFAALLMKTDSTWAGASYTGAAGVDFFTTRGADYMLPVHASIDDALTPISGSGTGLTSTVVDVAAGGFAVIYGCACTSTTCSGSCGSADDSMSRIQVSVASYLPPYTPASLSETTDFVRNRDWWNADVTTAGTQNIWTGVSAPVSVSVPAGLPPTSILGYSCRGSAPASTAITAGATSVVTALPVGDDHCFLYITGPRPPVTSACQLLPAGSDPACAPQASVVSLPVGPVEGVRIGPSPLNLLPYCNDTSVACSWLYLLDIAQGSVTAGTTFSVALQIARADGSLLPIADLPPAATIAVTITCAGVVRTFTRADAVPNTAGIEYLGSFVVSTSFSAAGLCILDGDVASQRIYSAVPLLTIVPAQPQTVTLPAQGWQIVSPFAGAALQPRILVVDQYGNFLSSHVVAAWGVTAAVSQGSPAAPVACTTSACAASTVCTDISAVLQCNLVQPGPAVLDVTVGGVSISYSFTISSQLPSNLTTTVNITTSTGAELPLLTGAGVGYSGCVPMTEGVPSSPDSVASCVQASSPVYDTLAVSILKATVMLRDKDSAAVALEIPAGFSYRVCLHPSVALSLESRGRSICGQCVSVGSTLECPLVVPATAAGRAYIPHLHLVPDFVFASTEAGPFHPSVAVTYTSLNGMALPVTAGGLPVGVNVSPVQTIARFMAAPDRQLLAPEGTVTASFQFLHPLVSGGTMRIPCPLAASSSNPHFFLRHEATGTLVSTSALAWQCRGDTAEVTFTPVFNSPAIMATHVSITAYVVTQNREAGVAWPATPSVAAQRANVASFGACLTGTGVVCQQHSSVLRVHYVSQPSTSTNFFSTGSHVAFTTSNSWTWFRDQLRITNGQIANGTVMRQRIFDAANTSVVFRNSAGMRITGFHGPLSYSTAPIYSARVSIGRTSDNTPNPVAVSNVLNLPQGTPCFDFMYEDPTTLAATTQQVANCFTQATDTAHSMYLPGDRDAARYASWAAGNYSNTVDFARMSFLMEMAQMELETSMNGDVQLNQFFLRMAAWSNPADWANGAVGSIPGSRNNVEARFVAALSGSGIWRVPQGTYTNPGRFRVQRGPDDFRATANLQPFVAGLGTTGSELSDLAWNKRQIRRKHMRDPNYPPTVRGAVDDVFRIVPRYKDAVNRPILDANLPNFRTSYARAAAYNRSVWHARDNIKPYFKSCKHYYREGNVVFDGNPTVDGTKYGWWAFNGRLDEAGMSGQPCPWYPMAVHSTLGLLDTRGIEAASGTNSERAVAFRPGAAADIMQPYGSDRYPLDVLALPVYPVNMPSHVRPVIAGTGLSASTHPNDTSTYPGPRSSTGAFERAVRVFWVDMDGDPAAGANIATGFSNPCRSELHPFDDLGIGMAEFEADTSLSPEPRPLANVTIRLIGNGTENAGQVYFSLTYVPRIGSPEWPQGNNPSSLFVDRCGEQDQMYLYSGPDGRSLFNCSTLGTCASEVWMDEMIWQERVWHPQDQLTPWNNLVGLFNQTHTRRYMFQWQVLYDNLSAQVPDKYPGVRIAFSAHRRFRATTTVEGWYQSGRPRPTIYNRCCFINSVSDQNYWISRGGSGHLYSNVRRETRQGRSYLAERYLTPLLPTELGYTDSSFTTIAEPENWTNRTLAPKEIDDEAYTSVWCQPSGEYDTIGEFDTKASTFDESQDRVFDRYCAVGRDCVCWVSNFTGFNGSFPIEHGANMWDDERFNPAMVYLMDKNYDVRPEWVGNHSMQSMIFAPFSMGPDWWWPFVGHTERPEFGGFASGYIPPNRFLARHGIEQPARTWYDFFFVFRPVFSGRLPISLFLRDRRIVYVPEVPVVAWVLSQNRSQVYADPTPFQPTKAPYAPIHPRIATRAGWPSTLQFLIRHQHGGTPGDDLLLANWNESYIEYSYNWTYAGPLVPDDDEPYDASQNSTPSCQVLSENKIYGYTTPVVIPPLPFYNKTEFPGWEDRAGKNNNWAMNMTYVCNRAGYWHLTVLAGQVYYNQSRSEWINIQILPDGSRNPRNFTKDGIYVTENRVWKGIGWLNIGRPSPVGHPQWGALPIRIQVAPAFQPFAREHDEPEQPSYMHLAGSRELVVGTCSDWYLRMKDMYGNSHVAELPWNVVHTFRPYWRPLWIFNDDPTTAVPAFRYEHALASTLTGAGGNEFSYNVGPNTASNPNALWRGYIGHGTLRVRACAIGPGFSANTTVTLAVQYHSKAADGVGNPVVHPPRWITPTNGSNILTMKVRLVSGAASVHTSTWLSPTMPSVASVPTGGCHFSLPASADISSPSTWNIATVSVNLTDSFGFPMSDMRTRLAGFTTAAGAPWVRAYVLEEESGWTALMDRTWSDPSGVTFAMPMSQITAGDGLAVAQAGGTFKVFVFIGDGMLRSPNRADAFSLCFRKAREVVIAGSTSLAGHEGGTTVRAGQPMALHVQLLDSFGNDAVNATLITAAATFARLLPNGATSASPVDAEARLQAGLVPGRYLLSGTAPTVAGFYTVQATVSDGSGSTTYSTNITVLPLIRASSLCIESVGPCDPSTFCSATSASSVTSCPGRLGIDVTARAPRLLRPADRLVIHVRGLDAFGNELRDTSYALPSAVVIELASGAVAVNHSLICPALYSGARVCTVSLADVAPGPLIVSVYTDSSTLLRFSSSLMGSISTAGVSVALAVVRAGAAIGPNVLMQSRLNATAYSTSGLQAACSAASALGLDTSSVGVSPITGLGTEAVTTTIIFNATGVQTTVPSLTAPGPMGCGIIERPVYVLAAEPGGLTLNVSSARVGVVVGSAISPAPTVAVWGSGLIACKVLAACTFRVALRQTGVLALGETPLLQPRAWGASARACISLRGATTRAACIENVHSLHVTGPAVGAATNGTFHIVASSSGLDFLSFTLNLTGSAADLLLPGSAQQGRPSTELKVSIQGLTVGALEDQSVETTWRSVQVHASSPSLAHASLSFVNRSGTWVDSTGTLRWAWSTALAAGLTPAAVPPALRDSQQIVIVTLKDQYGIPILWQRPSDGVQAQLVAGTSTLFTPQPPRTALSVPQPWYLGGGSYAVVVPPLTVGTSTLRVSLLNSAESVDIPINVLDESAIVADWDTSSSQANVTGAAGTGFSALPDVVRPASVSCRAGSPCTTTYSCRPAQLVGILSTTLTAYVAAPAVTISALGANIGHRYYRVIDVPAEVTVDSSNGGCAIQVSTVVISSGTHGLSVFFGGQLLTSVVPLHIRPQNQPALNGDFEWPERVYIAAGTASGLVHSVTSPVDIFAVDVYGNPTGPPTAMSFLAHPCVSSTPALNAGWSWNAAQMKSVVQVQSSLVCVSLTAATTVPAIRTVVSVGGGLVLGWPATLPINVGSGQHPQHLAAIPVSGPSPAASFSALLLSDAGKDLDAHMGGVVPLPLPPVPAQDVLLIRELMDRLASLTAQDRLPTLKTALDVGFPTCPVARTLVAPTTSCSPNWFVLPSTTAADAIVNANASVLSVLHQARLLSTDTYIAVWLDCPGEDPAHAPAVAVLPSGRPHSLLHTGTHDTRAWYTLPPILATGTVCLSKEVGVEMHGFQERCAQVVRSAVPNTAAVVHCAAEASQGGSACGMQAYDAPILCPLWASHACNDGTCAVSQAQCPDVPARTSFAGPWCPVDAPFMCGAHSSKQLSCVPDAWACMLSERPAGSPVSTVCPTGHALCGPHAGVSDGSPCVPIQLYPASCPTPVACGHYRSRCWDGYCYEKTALQLASEALSLSSKNITTLLQSQAMQVDSTPTCPLLAAHRPTTPTLGRVHCPVSKPIRCEDGSCAHNEGSCLGGHVQAHAQSLAAAIAALTSAFTQSSGSISPLASSTFAQAVQSASAAMRTVASCSGFSAGVVYNNTVGPLRLADGTCAHQLAHGLVGLAECTGSTPVLCPGGVICAASANQCAAIAACPPEEPWSCIALGGKCTASRASCAAAAVDPIGVLANDLRGAVVRETSSTVWTTTLQIALLVLLALFVSGTIMGLLYLWRHHKKHVKKHAAEHVRMTTQERDVEEKGSRSSKHESRSSRQDYPPSPVANAARDGTTTQVDNPMIAARGAGAMPRMPLASQKESTMSRVSMQLQQFVLGEAPLPHPTLLEESFDGKGLQPVAEGTGDELEESQTGAEVRGFLAERLRQAYSAVAEEVEEQPQEEEEEREVGQGSVDGVIVTNPLAVARGSEQQDIASTDEEALAPVAPGPAVNASSLPEEEEEEERGVSSPDELPRPAQGSQEE